MKKPGFYSLDSVLHHRIVLGRAFAENNLETGASRAEDDLLSQQESLGYSKNFGRRIKAEFIRLSERKLKPPLPHSA